jgi:hypothetical protein
MAQTPAPMSNPAAEGTAQLDSQGCVFYKLNFPAEVRINIWKIYFAFEDKAQRYLERFVTPNLIKALRQKGTLEIYYEALQTHWETMEFFLRNILSQHF